MRRTATVISVALLLVMISPGIQPVKAQTTDSARVTAPDRGSTHSPGYDGPIRVEWTSVTPPADGETPTYDVHLDRWKLSSFESIKTCSYSYPEVADGATTSCAFNPLDRGRYVVWVDGPNLNAQDLVFYVANGASGGPKLTSPDPGSDNRPRAVDALRFNFDGAHRGDYVLRLNQPGAGHISKDGFSFVGADFRFTMQVSPLWRRGYYDVSYKRDGQSSYRHLATFKVSPRLDIWSSVNHRTFYPLVKDGYRDKVKFTVHQNETTDHLVIKVVNDRHRVIRKERFDKGDLTKWRWNGRNRSGKKVSPGYYKLKAKTNDGPRQKATTSRRVRVRTRIVTKSKYREKRGVDTSSRKKTRYCHFFREYGHPGRLNLDCFGGRYAIAKYRFHLPATAFHVHGGVKGFRAGDDYAVGRIIHTAYRDGRYFRGAAAVTKYRSYTVKKVWTSYKYRRRI